MERFRKFVGWARISVFWRFAVVVSIALMAMLLFPGVTGVQTDSWEAMTTAGSSFHEFGILFGFLAVFFILFFGLIAIVFGLKAKQGPRPLHLLSAFGNAPASRAMQTNFSLLSPQDHLTRAAALTLASSQRDFPIVEDERLVGMLMQEDLFTALRQSKDQIQVANVMRREFPVGDSNDRLEDALNRLRTSGTHTLPVMLRDRLVGLFTMENAQTFLRIESAGRTDQEGVPGKAQFPRENRHRSRPRLAGSHYASGI